MRKLFLTLICVALCFGSCVRESNSMQTYVENFFAQYPEATLLDVYKGSFQDVFGPAHILTNREAVKNYILRELEFATRLEGNAYEPCGWQGKFYRVNLTAVKEGKISADELTDALMDSANGIDTSLTQAWLDEWQKMLHVVKTVVPELKGFSSDSLVIDQLLKEGKYVVHHSESFNKHYQPHYRIIRRDVFEAKILPKLNN